MTEMSSQSGRLCPAFRAGLNPVWLYPASGHRDALAMLEVGIRSGDPVTLMTGDAGTGKTLLLRALAANLQNDERIAWIDGDDADDEDPFDADPPSQTDAPADGPDSLAEDLQRFLDDDADGAGRGVLIVDDAHDLPDSALDQLGRLARMTDQGSVRVPILLAGRPELRARLAQSRNLDLQHLLRGQVNLPPFRAGESAGYVAHRLAVARCPCHGGISPFDSGSLRVLHHWSGGVPAVLNSMSQTCLRDADQEGLRKIGAVFAETSIRAALSLTDDASGQEPLPSDRLVLVPDDGAQPPLRGAAASAPVTDMPMAAAQPIPAGVTRRSAIAEPKRRLWPLLGYGVLAGATALGALWYSGLGRETDLTELAPPTTLPDNPVSPVPAPVVQVARADLPAAWQDDTAALTRIDAGSMVPRPTALLDEALEVGRFRPQEAAFLYQRAALWGNARAAYFLGQAYETGDGVGIDPNRARAWYVAAGNVWGAAARLAELPVASASDSVSAAVPVLQILFPGGGTELHWRAATGESPIAFAIEFLRTGDEAMPESVVTEKSAILLDAPIHSWRIVTLDAEGREAAATGWVYTTPPPG